MPDFIGISNFVYCNSTPNPPNVIKFTGSSPSPHNDSPLGTIAINSPTPGVADIWMMTYKINSNVTWTRLTGGGLAPIDNITVDAFTSPGTNPVLPNAVTGNIIITGNQVAAGSIGANVINTDSLAANSFTIQIQRSSAVAASDPTKNGVSHFNNSQFTVDANGFVSLNNQLIATLTTTDGASHLILAVSLGTTPGVYNFSGKVTAFDITDAAGAGYDLSIGARTTGIASSLIGAAITSNFLESAMTTAQVNIIPSSNSFQVFVTGITGKTIDWELILNYRFVS